MGDIEEKFGSNSTKDSKDGDGSQETDYSSNRAKDGPRDEDRVEHGGDKVIMGPEIDGIEVDGDRPYRKGGCRAGVSGDAEGCPRISFVLELIL